MKETIYNFKLILKFKSQSVTILTKQNLEEKFSASTDYDFFIRSTYEQQHVPYIPIISQKDVLLWYANII